MTDPREIFVSNLKKIMAHRDVTQKDISDSLEIPLTTVSSWYTGRSYPRVDSMQRLADFLRVSMRDLTDELEASVKTAISAVKIPLYSCISCGPLTFVPDEEMEYITLPDTIISKNGEYFAHYAKGDSMIDAGIQEGDLLIFSPSEDLESGEIGSFCTGEGEATCKRFYRNEDGVTLVPANKKYAPISISEDSKQFRIIGKLILHIRRGTF